MAFDTYQSLMAQGEEAREKAARLDIAIDCFEQASNQVEKGSREHLAAQLHLGLTYEHKWETYHNHTDLVYAERLYRNVLNSISNREDFRLMIAVVYRHLSSIMAKKKDFESAIEYAIIAYQTVAPLAEKPTNLVWFSHGVVKALITGKKSPYLIKEWLKKEREDLVYAKQTETNQLRISVWTSGYYKNRGDINPPWNRFWYLRALIVAKTGGAGLRIQQINRVLKIK